METPDNANKPNERHGCVTAWLILMIIANSMTALFSILGSSMVANNLPGDVSQGMIIVLGLVSIAMVYFAFMILRGKKFGFWGVVAGSLVALAINLSIGMNLGQSLIGLIGIVLLYAVLQIKKDGVSAWDNLV